jgi:quercetin dioxygenase-like cupin family protein
MFAARSDRVPLSDAWLDGDATARWSSATMTAPACGAQHSGSSVLEVEPGCRLPRHTDSVEETIIVLAGVADVTVGRRRAALPAGGVALVPSRVPHEVRNAGRETLRFLAMYAAAHVVTRYEAEVQPDGSTEREPLDA